MSSIPQVLNLLRTYRGQARILAGGTDLLVQMQTGEVKPKYVIDIKRIGELRGIGHLLSRGPAIFRTRIL